jgi:hypothetical protein
MTSLEILGFKPNDKPTKDELKNAHRRLVLVHHPDRGGDPKQFKKIQEAYDQLVADFDKPAEPRYTSRTSPGFNADDLFADMIRRAKKSQKESWKKEKVAIHKELRTTVNAKQLYEGCTKTFNIKYSIGGLNYETQVQFELSPRVIQKYTIEGRTSTGHPMTLELSISSIKPFNEGNLTYYYDNKTQNYIVAVHDESCKKDVIERFKGQGFENCLLFRDSVTTVLGDRVTIISNSLFNILEKTR